MPNPNKEKPNNNKQNINKLVSDIDKISGMNDVKTVLKQIVRKN